VVKKSNKRISVTVSNGANERIESIAAEFGMSVSQVGNLLILRGLDLVQDNILLLGNSSIK